MQRRADPRRTPSRPLVLAAAVLCSALPAHAQSSPVVELTPETAVQMGMDDSYRVRRLRLEVDRTRSLLQAHQAGLRSRVYMTFSAPRFERISESKWNSTLQRNEIVEEHSRLWQMDLTVEQPVVLLGYPTNGYLSLNNRVYRYAQIGDEDDVTYYNRYFVRYRQPLFQPNWLKSNLEVAELDLERAELGFQNDAVQIIDDIVGDYYDLFEIAYRREIYREQLEGLEQLAEAARAKAAADPARGIDVSRAQVELANAREQLQQARSDFRLAASRMKQRLRLAPGDSLVVVPQIELTPLRVDVPRAIEYGLSLRPQLRTLDIQRRKDEMDLENTRDSDRFRVNLEFTFGREMTNPELQQLMHEPSNSYTVGVLGQLPIWDWGAKRARVEAERLSLERTKLSMEETREGIELEIRNVVRSVEEYQQRARNMEENLDLAREVTAMSLEQYRGGEITMLDLLQAYERQEDTAENFLEAYLGYRGAMLDLQRMTFFDFERQMPLLERYGIRTARNPLASPALRHAADED